MAAVQSTSRDHHRDGYRSPSLWPPRRSWHPSSAVFEVWAGTPASHCRASLNNALICHWDQPRRAVGTTASEVQASESDLSRPAVHEQLGAGDVTGII